jgi:predicted esterase YcpF (UPF0227 family)
VKFLKENWMIILGVLLVAFLAWREYQNSNDYDALMDDYLKMQTLYKEEQQKLAEADAEKAKALKALGLEYESRILILKQQHSKALQNIQKQSNVKRKEIVKRAKEDPTTLTREVNRVFGIPVHERTKP